MVVCMITRWAVCNRLSARKASTVLKSSRYLSYLIHAGRIRDRLFEMRPSTQASLLAYVVLCVVTVVLCVLTDS